jgi:parvulin-like peptidyl-prolyl isomerase
MGNQAELLDFAFNQKIGATTDVLNNQRSFIVAQVARHIPAGVPPLEEIRNQVNQNLVKQMLLDQTMKVAKEIYEETQSGAGLEKAANHHNARYFTPPPFVRSGFVQGIGKYPEVIGAAFALSEPSQVSQPVEYVNGSAIFQLISKQSPDLTTFNEKRDSVYNAVLMQKQRKLYQGWYQNLVENADIENNIAKADLNDEEQQ